MTHRRISRTVRRGATLAEVSISTVLVGIVLVAAVETTGSAVRTARLGSSAADGSQLAEALLAEALSLPYEDPDGNPVGIGIEPDETDPPTDRLGFDDFDDFDDWTDQPPTGPDGAVIAGYDGWKRDIRVVYAEAKPSGGTTIQNVANDEGVKRIRVSVTSPAGVQTHYWAVRTPYGTPDQPSSFDRNLVTGVAVSLSVGSGDASAASTAPINAPTLP